MKGLKQGAIAVLFAGGMVGPACVVSGSSCVSGRAWIATPEGRRRLEELEVGDEVWSVDPESGERVAGAITAVEGAERECVELEAGADATLVCTSDHPVWDPAAGEYADAGDWAVGNRSALLVARGDGVEARDLAACEEYAGVHAVYDITVDTDHHNFIANGVVVHNKKQTPEQCRVNGEMKTDGAACMCPDGATGNVDCFEGTSRADTGGASDKCRCPESDAGMDGGGG